MDIPARTAEKLGKLVSLLEDSGRLLVVMQDAPDPDAIASATALRHLASSIHGVSCTLAYGSTVGRAENRALIRYLGIRLQLFKKMRLHDFDLVATVDTQPGTGNNPLPHNVIPDIVIDHHPMRQVTRSAPFNDVRGRYGATSTIMWEYLAAAGAPLSPPLATALAYGISSDTQDFGCESTNADIQALEALYPLANKRMLGLIKRGSVPDEYYQMLLDGIRNATVCGSCIVTSLGKIDNPDMLGEIADLLLRHECACWTMCLGRYGNTLLLSIRTEASDRRADDVAHRVARRIGSSGGHAAMAGAQIPLRGHAGHSKEELERIVIGRFLDACGGRKRPRQVPLVRGCTQ